MAVEGTLDLFRLPEVLQVISQERKTGILTVQGPEDIVAVSFLQGRIVAADALNATTEEGLGAVLVEEGRVPEEVLQRLAGRAELEGVRLADLLIQEGHVDREGVLEALRALTTRLLLALIDWRRGEFKFYGGDEVSYEEGFRSIGVDELLLSAAEERARGESRAVPALDSRLRRLEPNRPIRVRVTAGLDGASTGIESNSAIWVTPAEQRVLEAVEPTRTVEEVAQQAEVSTDHARYLLYRFVREGLVTTVYSSERHTPAPRPAPGARSAPTVGPAMERRPETDAAPTPAETRAAPARRPKRARRETGVVGRLQTAGLAVLAVAVTMMAVAATSVSFLLPFPWLGAERAAVHDERDSARLLELDQAAKTFFLLQGRFPDDLQELVSLGLLEPHDLVDSRGRPFAYEPRERSYRVHPVVPGGPADVEEFFHEGIGGNFLLDPDFLAGARNPSSTEPPLVLLD